MKKIVSISSSKKRASNVLFYPSIVILTVVTIFPLLFVIYNSLREYWLTDPSKTQFIWLKNYTALFTDQMFLHSLKITVLFVVLAVAIELILGMILALLLEKNTPFFNFLRGFILLPMMLTPIVVGLLWKFIYDASFGILNYFIKIVFGKGLLFIGSYEQALFSVILVDIWQWTPFVFLILSAGLKTLDHELYEAASIDGATKIQQFFHLTIPLIKNVITIAVLFRVIDALRIFDIVYAMTGGGPADATMFLALYNYRIGFKFFNLGYGSSIAIIQVIMLAIVLVLMTKILKIEL